MDPFTLVVIAAIGWWIRNVAEDAWAFARREPSPRLVRQRERQRLTQERVAATGQPTIGQAVAGRVATRIADRPEHGFLRPLREFLAERWADALTDAIEQHRRRREERPDRTDVSPAKPLIAVDCKGKCGRLVVSPITHCTACERRARDAGDDQSSPEPPTSPSPPPAYCANHCGRPVPSRADWCPACTAKLPRQPEQRCTKCRRPGVALDEIGECPECQIDTEEDFANQERLADLDDDQVDNLNDQPTETPEPTPAPDTTRKDTPPVTPPVTTPEINGDVTNPLESLAFADSCLVLNDALRNELDAMANNLEGEGVGAECVQIVRDAQAAADQFSAAAAGARDEFARHVATQADIASDTELRDTVRGTYLDTSRA